MVNQQKIGGPGTAIRLLGVVWVGRTHVVLEAVIYKVQTCPTPEKRERRRCTPLWGFDGLEDFYSPPVTVLPSLMPPGEERAHVGLGIRTASHV